MKYDTKRTIKNVIGYGYTPERDVIAILWYLEWRTWNSNYLHFDLYLYINICMLLKYISLGVANELGWMKIYIGEYHRNES